MNTKRLIVRAAVFVGDVFTFGSVSGYKADREFLARLYPPSSPALTAALAEAFAEVMEAEYQRRRASGGLGEDVGAVEVVKSADDLQATLRDLGAAA